MRNNDLSSLGDRNPNVESQPGRNYRIKAKIYQLGMNGIMV
ncbi:MAG: hypothetical protein ACLTKE_01305 [Coprococcus sp.]